MPAPLDAVLAPRNGTITNSSNGGEHGTGRAGIRDQAHQTQVMSICGMSRSSVYLSIKNGQFPSPVKLSTRSIAWLRSEVIAWVESRIKATRGEAVGNAAGSAGQRVLV